MALVKHGKTIILHPLTRGMFAYGVIWPTGSIIQQTMAGCNWESYDWKKCMRFSVYGMAFVAPTLYTWVRISSRIWPQRDLRTAITKALVEQVSYGPFASASFFFAMTYLETQNGALARKEVADKLWPTYKVGMCVWPILSTINFSLIPERNRVVFVSVCSLLWTTFLAYMKQLDNEKKTKESAADAAAAANLEVS